MHSSRRKEMGRPFIEGANDRGERKTKKRSNINDIICNTITYGNKKQDKNSIFAQEIITINAGDIFIGASKVRLC